MSDVAVCRASASFNSRLRASTCSCGSTAEGARSDVAFSALRRFGLNVLRRRVLTGSLPALERRFIASPEAQERTSYRIKRGLKGGSCVVLRLCRRLRPAGLWLRVDEATS